ncbi:MAG: histidine kinase N-terminal 7TM domain-containing protein [Christensenellales bacterium]|jgi:two-component system sensor histidine kinase HupT/HoxJ
MNELWLYVLCITTLFLIGLLVYILSIKKRSILHNVFLTIVIELIIWSVAVIFESLAANIGDADMIMFWENMTYLGSALAPVSLLVLGLVFAYPERAIYRLYKYILIVPIISIIMVWTNDYHHLFYQSYSALDTSLNVTGPYFYFHAAYMYVCMLAGLGYLVFFAIKNSGILSLQAITISVGSIIPLATNVLYTIRVPGFTVHTTPAAFALTLALFALGIFRYNLLKITPIATQTVVNRISDSFVVIDSDYRVIDHNKAFEDNFILRSGLQPRAVKNLSDFADTKIGADYSVQKIKEFAQKVFQSGEAAMLDFSLEWQDEKLYYIIELTPIAYKNNHTAAVILLFKDITQHVMDTKTIQENQVALLERERLAMLGQLIGGIAHNLRTPIMSVAGSIDQIRHLTEEYRDSIGDSSVTDDDHREIAGEIMQWTAKVKTHMGYMADIISTVKDQATKFIGSEESYFTIEELFKRVNILMRHELTKSACSMTINTEVDLKTKLKGDINSLVQVFDNIIVNAIQAYGGKPGVIKLDLTKENDNLIFAIKDKAGGIDKSIRTKLLNAMVTTKGKYGTGLGLYMSHSTVKGGFRGKMWFETRSGDGTTFYISIPLL